jgi:hypothetical protein
MLFDPRSEEYEEGLVALQDAVKQMNESGVDFSKKSVRTRFEKALITNMRKLANDPRLYDKIR